MDEMFRTLSDRYVSELFFNKILGSYRKSCITHISFSAEGEVPFLELFSHVQAIKTSLAPVHRGYQKHCS